MESSFPKLRARVGEFLARGQWCKTRPGVIELVCRDCEFFKEGEKEDYECAGFQLIRRLLEKDLLSVETILRALEE